MSKKGFLSSLIFKDDSPEQASKEVPKTGKNDTNNSALPPMSNTSLQGIVDNKFIDMLEGIIEQNNLPGQDYFEFKQATENMKALVMDEKTKFQTVYTVLSLQGCKKDILLSSINKYVSIIQGEKANFDSEMKAEYANRVQSKLNEVDKAKNEIVALSKKLTELNNLVLTLSQGAQAEELKLRATEANFKSSADMIINEMISDKEKINNYIS